MNYYCHNARRLYREYRSLDPEELHRGWLEYMPGKPRLACDIGAGSGRDANWLAEKGWEVVAVEPVAAFRELAEADSHPRISWIDDGLPGLSKLRRLDYRFDLILLSAVWMHLPRSRRERAFRVLSDLLAPGGLLVISMRQESGAGVRDERGFHPVEAEELLQFATRRALQLETRYRQPDAQGRANVEWETLCFRLPDDGTGSLPLLRHIIVNDNKSSSYKLGLLRTLLRIAEGAPGMVLRRDEDWVEIPFGLVGLFWLKLYIPLVTTHRLRQHGGSQGYGFARDDFRRLSRESAYDLRIGAPLGPELAAVVTGAIRDVCGNIKRMPANYITFPGRNRTVFECERQGVRRKAAAVVLDKEYLSRFGVFRIPVALWQTLGQYACWLEPAIVNEWAELMRGWCGVPGDMAAGRAAGARPADTGIRPVDVADRPADMGIFHRALEWEENRRDTSIARRRVELLRDQGRQIHCVWSNRNIAHRGDNYAVDHCFPWSRWRNNDLWNLMPASTRVNAAKGDKLPSAEAVLESRPRIVNWWERAYSGSDLERRFHTEAESALPILQLAGSGNLAEGMGRTLEAVFDAMLLQRAKLRVNQQLAEWSP